jgi:crossover junction endodeoxyribonuclease RuvC
MPPKIQAFPLPGQRARGRVGSTLRRAQRLSGLPVARRILGIDPGLHITGYGLIEVASDECQVKNNHPVKRHSSLDIHHLIECGVLKAKADDPLPQRLQSLYDALDSVLREYQPDAVVIEELFSTYAHPRSALLMAHARGVLMLAAQQSGASVHSFLPNEVKQVLTGNGHATKTAVQAAVRSQLRLAAAPQPADVADALALALCFAARQEVAGLLT